jgi:hypothetical protein
VSAAKFGMAGSRNDWDLSNYPPPRATILRPRTGALQVHDLNSRPNLEVFLLEELAARTPPQPAAGTVAPLD